MNIVVKKRNSKTGEVKSWHFYTLWDLNSFDSKGAANKIVFARYHLCDKNNKPIQTYDVTDKQARNCTWKQAQPPQHVIDKAWEKFSETWNFEIQPIRD